MTTDDYNKYIKNYFENSKTDGALMLTSSWGRGKSYYINNYLINHIGQEQCVNVSLYGLKSIEEISKAIYIEVRAKKWLLKKNEKLSAIALAGRTLLRGLLSYFKINITPEESELQNLYCSINLSKKLIILEDVERSCIPVVDILGYVNNLCEQDGLKVLLVANEDIILSSAKVEEYYLIKEKTVSDTIIFNCAIEVPISNVLESYANKHDNFAELLKAKDAENKSIAVKEIAAIMQEDAKGHESYGYNLRSLIFACQKTEDMFREALDIDNQIEFSQEFFKSCLFGNIAFSLKLKRGTSYNSLPSLKWENNLDSPAMLGCEKYPLLKVCYDFIMEQKLENFIKTIENYPQVKIKEENWRKLKNYRNYSFNDLTIAIKEIHKLINKEAFPIDEFGILANRLFSIKATIGNIDILTELLNLIKINLKKAIYCPYEVYSKIVNPSAAERFETNGEYEIYKKELSQIIIQKAIKDIVNLTITEDGINQFHRLIDAYEGGSNDLFYYIRTEFASKLDIEKLVDNLLQCSPETVANFRRGFDKIYNVRNNELSNVDNNIFMNNEKTIRELFETLPQQFKDGDLQSSYFSPESKDAINKFKEVFERKFEGIPVEKFFLEERENVAIKKLIEKLELKTTNSQMDKILNYQLTIFKNELKNLYNHLV